MPIIAVTVSLIHFHDRDPKEQKRVPLVTPIYVLISADGNSKS